MKHLQNERGNAIVLTLWIMLVMMAMLVIIVNIGKAFAIKEQASIGAEQAAFAATAEIIKSVKVAVEDFDDDPLVEIEIGEDGVSIEVPTDTGKQRIDDHGRSINQLIEEKKNHYKSQGKYENEAYIMAVNEILAPRIDRYDSLKEKVKNAYNHAYINSAARQIVLANFGKGDETEVVKPASSNNWRVKVEVKVTFESISDGKYVSSFKQDVLQVGYGPKLTFIEKL